ncbi:DedA family protein [Streptomyces sp. PTM05]|uniref:DedA family protein n=1 Tax=Streptantibioticus parmotrematis TaxID=2873249 RepID=A0ABS7QJ94_9ACTN|nr:DedA family protein [Streptantibioticus parmotrematis]MBY8883239.1 DedA family protein [Streptantibioticus parmotrematis]
MHVQEWLQHIPPVVVYVVVAAVIGVESLGIPLPGEIVLVSASLLAVGHTVDPLAVGASAVVGAVIGDSIGYAIGHRYGKAIFERLGRRFPKHFGPDHIAKAERSFQRWGMWAVFFGRFIAFLRIFAGPLAGVLRMPYWKFLTANLLGGIAWAGGTTAAVYYVGVVAEKWLKDISYVGLAAALVAIAAGVAIAWRRSKAKAAGRHGEDDGDDSDEHRTRRVGVGE